MTDPDVSDRLLALILGKNLGGATLRLIGIALLVSSILALGILLA